MNNAKNAEALVDTVLAAGRPVYTATVPLLAHSTRSLGNAFSELERDLMPSVISHEKGAAYDEHLNLLRLCLLNLVAVAFSHEHLNIQTTPRKGSWINEKYNLDQRKTKRLVDTLKASGLMKQTLYGSRHAHITNAYRPTEHLLRPYAHFLYSYQGDFEDYAPIKFNKEDFEGDIPWHDHTERDREILLKYNAFMASHTWARKDVTHRSFNDKPFTAARIHTPYQTIANRRVEIRKQTLIDGEPIKEPDFSANHLTLLSILFDEQLPESPYDRVADDTSLAKATVKTVLVRLMGAENEQGFNRAKWKLERERDKVSRTQVNEIRKSFYKCIPFLKTHNLLCTGWGNKLQYIEGETGILMLKWATEEKIPIINVHDAYACRQRNETLVKSMMHDIRMQVLNDLDVDKFICDR